MWNSSEIHRQACFYDLINLTFKLTIIFLIKFDQILNRSEGNAGKTEAMRSLFGSSTDQSSGGRGILSNILHSRLDAGSNEDGMLFVVKSYKLIQESCVITFGCYEIIEDSSFAWYIFESLSTNYILS